MSIIIAGKAPDREYRWVLRRGQRAKVGRSPWADFCIVEDDQLRDFHCQIELGQHRCPAITAIDDAQIEVADGWESFTGGREQLRVVAGQTLLVLIRDKEKPNDMRPTSENKESADPIGVTPAARQLDIRLLREIGISDKACRMIVGDSSLAPTSLAPTSLAPTSLAPTSLALTTQALLDQQLYEDAVRYVAASLSTPLCLRWCSQMLRQLGHQPDGNAAGLVQLWLSEPTEALRQAIVVHVDWNRKLDPCTWLMASIGWTGGNLSPVGSIHVAPTQEMVITGVITALSLAGAQRDTVQFQKDAVHRGVSMCTDVHAPVVSRDQS